MWQRIRTLIVKEFLAVWRDPKSRMILIVPPLVELLVFSFAATQEVKNVQIAILNRDTGTNARDLIAMFSGSPNFSAIDFLDDESQIAPAIDSRQSIFVLYIQSDFSRELNAGRPATVQLLLDGRRSNAAQIVEGYANAIVARYNEELLSASRASPPSTVFVGRLWFNPNQTVTWNTVPSLVAILTTLMGLLVTALSVARRARARHVRAIAGFPLGTARDHHRQGGACADPGHRAGQRHDRRWRGAVPRAFPGFARAALRQHDRLPVRRHRGGLVRFELGQNATAGHSWRFVFMVPAMCLSGFASPIENMPDWLQYATLANPIRYYIVIVKGIFLKDVPASVILANLWPMAVIALVTLSSTAWLFRHRME